MKADGAVHRAFSEFTVAELPVQDVVLRHEHHKVEISVLKEKLHTLMLAVQAFDVYLSDIKT